MFANIPIVPIVMILLGLAAAGSGAGLLHAEQRIGGLTSSLDAALHDRDQARLDLNAKTTAYTALDQAHQLCMGEIKTSREAQARAIGDLATIAAHLQQESQHVRTIHETIFKEPGCDELAKLDIAARCPDLAQQLRQRSAYLSAPPTD